MTRYAIPLVLSALAAACSSAPTTPTESSSSAIEIHPPPSPGPPTPIHLPPAPACGEADQPACATTAFPDCIPTGCNCDEVNLTVVSGTCIPCGANGEVECKAVPSVGYPGGCNEGSIASAGGTCGPCGAQNQPACQACGEPDGPTCPLSNDGCNDGTVNVNQECVCGALNQIACAVGAKCAACASGSCALGTNSDGSGVVVEPVSGVEECLECGTSGNDPCTTGNACAAGYGDIGGRCTVCGSPGADPCPGSDPCDPGYSVVSGKCACVAGTPSGTMSLPTSPVAGKDFTIDLTFYTGDCSPLPKPSFTIMSQTKNTLAAVSGPVNASEYVAMPAGNKITLGNLDLPADTYRVYLWYNTTQAWEIWNSPAFTVAPSP
jgi:hypothetical protein